MGIVLRFVDINGYLRERFFELVHVKYTTSKDLKEEISMVLSNHELSIQNLRGQAYDGASNMRGEWNGLKALFMEERHYAYYVHYLAHQLQLALIATAREVAEVHDFFKDLIFIVNDVSSSSKRHDELQASQIAELENLIEIEEVETGKGLNQIGTLQRPGDTRWSSNYKSIYSLLKMYNATRSILVKIAIDRRVTYSEIIQSRRNKDTITVEHHYRVDVFNAVADKQLQELNSRFSERTTELLTLSASLSPINGYKHFNVENICLLAEKYYPEDFSESLLETRKSVAYPLVDRLIQLILTLPVSTTTTERAFSAMKIVKTCLRNKIEDDFLFDYFLVYIEKEIAGKFEIKSIIDDFYSMKPRRARVK
ncbi:uncharacterized protein LOC110697724 [Chenopodium quinoa]|uniref:uncharacterized protein LOC110697724 n=1 Tax=Chenopodium quinoa TaxID=63459 RepID=UPI000B78F4BF|nr:uncharacterized protein LOC110697724 [Chenopodium quinoa]